MRGDIAVEVPVPLSGWIAALPPHKLPPNSLRSGSNLLLTSAGTLTPRGGYSPVQVPFAVDERVMAGISFEDQDGNAQTVVATLLSWYYLNGTTWTALTGPTHGTKDDPVRLEQFGIDPTTGHSVVYGVNGPDNDQLWQWISGNATSNAVQNLLAPPATPGGTGPATIKAADLTVISDRLVLGNVTTDSHHPNMVIWSDVLDGTSWHALSNDPLTGIGNIVAVRRSTRLSGVVYGETGAINIYAVAGTDAGAFAFPTRIEGVTVGPISANALIEIGGIHYYLARDFRIWRCDGQNAAPISNPIDAAIKPTGNVPDQVQSLATSTAQRPLMLHDVVEDRLWIFVTTQRDAALFDEAQSAYPLNLRHQIWEPPSHFATPITAAFPVIEQNAPTWNNPGPMDGGLAVTTLTAAISDTATSISLTSAAKFPTIDGVDITLPPVVLIGTEWITYTNIVGNTLTGCVRGAFDTTAVAHAAGATVIAEVTWESAIKLWPNWNAIPDERAQALYIGTPNGELFRFGNAVDDNGTPIPWLGRWALINAPDPKQEIQVNTVDVMLEPVAGDDLRVQLSILKTPFDPNPVQILDRRVFGSEDLEDSWEFRLQDADPEDAAFRSGFYMDFQITGQSNHGGPIYAGTMLYAYPTQRADKVVGVPRP